MGLAWNEARTSGNPVWDKLGVAGERGSAPVPAPRQRGCVSLRAKPQKVSHVLPRDFSATNPPPNDMSART